MNSTIRVTLLTSILSSGIAHGAGHEIEFSLYYQAPETEGRWVLMFDRKEMSGVKLTPAKLPTLTEQARRMAKQYCAPNRKWYDESISTFELTGGERIMATYVEKPLARKQPDAIKAVYFTGTEEVFPCEAPAEKPCPPNQICFW